MRVRKLEIENFRGITEGRVVFQQHTLLVGGNNIGTWVVQWWAEEGGEAISFASDAHTPDAIAANFPEAVILAEAFGFRPGSKPEELWRR